MTFYGYFSELNRKGVFIISNLPHTILTFFITIFFTELIYLGIMRKQMENKTLDTGYSLGYIYITKNMCHFRQLTCTGTKLFSHPIGFSYLSFSQQLLKPHLSSFTISIFAWYFNTNLNYKDVLLFCFLCKMIRL